MREPHLTAPGRQSPAPGAEAPHRAAGPLPHPLPWGEFSLETHFDVLRRFMSASRNGVEPVEPAAVEGTGLPPNAAQLNAPFLCDIGLLIEEKAGRFKPTPVAMQFINTEIGDEGRARKVLRSIIAKTWFAAAARALRPSGVSVSFGEQDLMAAFAEAAHAPAGDTEASAHILMEYLAYTGILVLPAKTTPKEAASATAPSSALPAPVSVTPERPSVRVPELSTEAGSRPTEEAGDWEVIQTGEFYLKIRPKPAVLKRLKKQLDLLAERLREDASSRKAR